MTVDEDRWNMLNDVIKFKSTDTLVVTYPKCGTTWLEQSVLLLLNEGDVDRMNAATKNSYSISQSGRGKIWPEACVNQNPIFGERLGPEFVPLTVEQFENAPSPRVIKSHAPLNLLLGSGGLGIEGLPEGAKVVIVARNPLDACVSSYYHAFNPHKSGWPFDAWAALWLSGNFAHGSYFDWVKNWSKHAKEEEHQDRILWIQFEDVKAEPVRVMTELAHFLGVGGDAALVQRAVEASSFESMREQATQGGDTALAGHLRKGVAGDWRNHFSPALVEEFVATFERECAGSGLRFSLGVGERVIEASEA